MNSYEQILAQMTDKYAELTGIKPQDASDVGIRMKVLAYQIYSLESSLEQMEKQLLPQTAQGEYLEKHAVQRGIKRKLGTAATGEVVFTRSGMSVGEITIPIGSIVATLGEDSVRYSVTKTVLMAANASTVTAGIVCTETGSRGNATPNTIKLLITPISGVDIVNNAVSTNGGTDQESDQRLRDRLLKSYANISNGSNTAYYLKEALSYEGIGFAGVIPRSRGRGTVDVVVHGTGGAASNAIITGLRDKLAEKREVNVDVAVVAATIKSIDITVTLAPKQGFNFTQLKEIANQKITDYINNLTVAKPLYQSSLTAIVMGIEGMANCTTVITGGDIYPLKTEIIRTGTIAITAMQVSGG
ncbi:MAG: baseplate J/gp47 family protein [Oscillospiraceae bacterium]